MFYIKLCKIKVVLIFFNKKNFVRIKFINFVYIYIYIINLEIVVIYFDIY